MPAGLWWVGLQGVTSWVAATRLNRNTAPKVALLHQPRLYTALQDSALPYFPAGQCPAVKCPAGQCPTL